MNAKDGRFDFYSAVTAALLLLPLIYQILVIIWVSKIL